MESEAGQIIRITTNDQDELGEALCIQVDFWDIYDKNEGFNFYISTAPKIPTSSIFELSG